MMQFLQHFGYCFCTCDFNIDFALFSENVSHNRYFSDTFHRLRIKHWTAQQTVPYLRQ